MNAPNIQAPGEVGTGRALRGSENTDAASVPLAGADDKRRAHIAAALERRGYVTRALPEGAGYVVGRWGLFKHCATIDELHAFALRVGAIA